MTFILHLIRWQGLQPVCQACPPSRLISFWVYLKDSKIRRLCAMPACLFVVLLVHDPEIFPDSPQTVHTCDCFLSAVTNRDWKLVLGSQSPSLPVSKCSHTSSRTPCRLRRRLVDKVKQFVEISWKLNEIVKSISHILLFLYSFSNAFSARQSF